ncbi:hypothetical protein MRX96_039982 [Rhipicephalus microplus]
MNTSMSVKRQSFPVFVDLNRYDKRTTFFRPVPNVEQLYGGPGGQQKQPKPLRREASTIWASSNGHRPVVAGRCRMLWLLFLYLAARGLLLSAVCWIHGPVPGSGTPRRLVALHHHARRHQCRRQA